MLGTGDTEPVRSLQLVDKIKDMPGFTSDMGNFYLDETPLTIAAREGKSDIVTKLIECGLELKESKEAQVALGWAAGEGRSGIVKQFLEHGVTPNCASSLLGTPLRRAAWGGHLEVVKLLIAYRANVNTEIKGDSPLWAASHFGHTEIFDFLLESGADVNKPETCGNTPLHSASSGYMAERLLSRGALISSRNCNSETPIITLTHKGSVEAVTKVVLAGANVNDQCCRGRTALHLAAGNFNEEILVAFLIGQGANPNA